MKILSIINDFTKWAIIGDELYVFHPMDGKIRYIKSQTVIQLWRIALDSSNTDIFIRKVKESMKDLSKDELNNLITKFFTLFSNYLKEKEDEDNEKF